MRFLVTALCLMGVSTAADAQAQREDKVVCKRQYEPDTGSHFRASKKVCMKKSEWKALEDETDQTLRNMSERSAPGGVERGPTGGSTPQ